MSFPEETRISNVKSSSTLSLASCQMFAYLDYEHYHVYIAITKASLQWSRLSTLALKDEHVAFGQANQLRHCFLNMQVYR